MSWLGVYELTHPESLSERQLREVLRNSCIEILHFDKLCKNELLEMYKQVVMPLPQRRVNAKDSEAETIAEKSFTATSDNTFNWTCDLNKGNKRMSHSSCPQTDRLKSLTNEGKSVQKKSRLCLSEVAYNGSKRICDEQTEGLLIKKRQKITWP